MIRTLVIAALAGTASFASAQVVWDETVDGNLSNDPANPTLLNFSVGTNIVRGSTLGPSIAPSDGYDAFGFTIEAGWTLEAIILSAYSPATGGTSGFNFSSGAPLPGGNLIFGPGVGGANVGQDFLVTQSIGTLGADDYFMEVREFGGPIAVWELTFTVVPAPSAMAMLGLGGLVAARRRR
jgi:hypothetical protein